MSLEEMKRIRAYKQLLLRKKGYLHAEVQSIEKVEQLTDETHIFKAIKHVQYIEPQCGPMRNKQLKMKRGDCKERQASCKQAHEA
ncbi:hypothetical protein CW304_11945 [Bacillus sp. UFRGS-B20]|nr:hypothetical protein CW304_11945 [Bacillus sp. UFRGS-B20]